MSAFERGKRILSALLVLVFLAGLLPAAAPRAQAADNEIFATFTAGAVLLDSTYSGKNVIIENGVFSVTVSGATDVNIIFNGVTIDRRYSADSNATGGGLSGTQITNLYHVSDTLKWGGKAPVCPFLVTGNSSVTATFRGTCRFYAGTNGCTVASDNTYTAVASGAGYAGIQVDSGSTLVIADAVDLTVYGAHQIGTADANGEITVDGTTYTYSDVLRANTTIAGVYTDPWPGSPYKNPNNTNINKTTGGAGIGGGAAYNTTNSGTTDYTAGTPGTIIINSGKIEAYGGHQAAGIGGGLNGAATNDKIVINGGTIIAHGGRWAAGIGDGDSAPSDNITNTSTSFENKSSIEINGGTVTAYGGVGSAGIGCTDGLNSKSMTSGMEIAINGGAVNAFSGFPDKFNGTYSSEAPAAIGAGSKSNMESNSIYVSSAATLSCAAFGNYAITENGVNSEAIPVINVDSDGYLLLLRTGEYYSTKERTLNLYLPQTQTISVTGDNGEEEEVEVVLYVDQSTGIKYYVDPEFSRVYNEDSEQVTETSIISRLTLYVDGNSRKVDNIDLAYYFRSIALTLPDPNLYGGLYALTVPVDGVTTDLLPKDDDFITLTVEAHTQGTQSGVVDYPSQHNMDKDSTAVPLTDLDAYEGAVTPSGDGLIGSDFRPGVYAYTVYVESDCTETTLYARFDDAEDGTKYELLLDNVAVSEVANHDFYREAAISVALTGDKTTIRLKKRDNGDNLGAVVYKITFIKKGEYKLELSDPSKVYDGAPVSVNASSVYSGTLYTLQKNILSDTSTNNVSSPVEVFSLTGQRLRCGTGDKPQYIRFDMTGQVLPTEQPNVVHYVFTFDNLSASSSDTSFTDSGGYCLGFAVTYPEDGGNPTFARLAAAPDGYEPGEKSWITEVTSSEIAKIGTKRSVSLEFSKDTGQVRIIYNGSSSTNSYTLVEFGSALLTRTGSDTETAAHEQAQAALKTGTPGNEFDYVVNQTYSWSQNLTPYDLTTSGASGVTIAAVAAPDYTKEVVGNYEIVSGGEAVEYISATEAELNSARFTFYEQTVDGEGNTVFTSIGTQPPTDAGTYRVDAVIRAKTYNAEGSLVFTVSPRPVTVLQIENWLVYKSGEEMDELHEAGATTLAISDPGRILLDNVVRADEAYVSLSVDAAGGNVYYNSITVTYAAQKITLVDAVLTGDQAHNYLLIYDDDATRSIYVFGQIAYSMNGAIFRKTESGLWLKFYPVDAEDPVGTGGTADYHSPLEPDTTNGAYLSHAEYVKARTVNEKEAARYSVDLEYGAMQFTYYYSVWDVNELAYEETDGFYWEGMDGSNNKLTVINYSNQPIQYQMSAVIDFFYADHDGSGVGITAAISADEDGSSIVAGTAWSTVAAATPGNNKRIGVPEESVRWLVLSGVPQMHESTSYATVGRITLTVAPVDNSS